MNATFLLVLALVLMAASAFFSASETAFFSLDELKIRKFKPSDARHIRNLLKNATILLVTLLTANTITNILLTTVLSAWLEAKGYHFSFLVSTLIVSGIIILFGEILPKAVATAQGVKIIPYAVFPVSYLIRVLDFIIRPLNRLSERFTQYFQFLLPEMDNKEDRRTALYNVVSRGKFLKQEEKLLIARILSLAERRVTAVMTPRPRVFSIDEKATLEQLKNDLLPEQHSKIPVYKDQDSQVIGVIYFEDIAINFRDSKSLNLNIKDFIRPIYFVPESKTLAELLEDFRKKHIRIAAVVDEYGDFLGIVTLSDILAELVGEVVDEDFEKDIVQLLPNRYFVKGEVSLLEFNEEFKVNLVSEEYETIAGYLIEQAGGIPPLFYSYEHDNLVLTVRERTATRIESLSVRIK
ncbi:putative hemolysin [Brevinema andersonii]|uniref:Putative hemolysin n=1 Tax=Brevinema andersonii TaxID=34097 RepID=A0A1I1DUF7_BREAD|nr:hemolysin family protein [Brevinema andersonii]SFB78679.1 putative hemolysin [Brevinema andersonii]